jgi:nucleoside-diphosphate-sugar epimerase
MKGLIFGCGYLGQRVAIRWREGGAEVCVVTRSAARADNFNKEGYEAIVADVTRPETLKNLPTADVVLFSVGHDRTVGQSIEDVYSGGVRNVLNVLPPSVQRFIYISTTGVYGPAEGDWVDERTPPDPRREGGRASLAAEQAVASHPLGANSFILRLAGLYGPGRVPFLKELQAGDPIPAPSQGYLNLIHVDDAAATVIAADRLPAFDDGPRIYCVSDGHPVERGEFYCEVARPIGASYPKFVEPDPESPRAARAAADRRIRNARMIQELNVKLAYPDYRAGLAAILETQNQ